MKRGLIIGVVCALALHAAFILFGGLLIPGHGQEGSTVQQVELLSTDDTADKEKEKEKPPEDEAKTDELETEVEKAPDAAEMIRNLELSEAAKVPELEAASLSAIEAALNGQGGGGGDFAEVLDFASGGRIGGTGKAGMAEQKFDDAFSLAEIDQKPRSIFQAAPSYPATMRGRKIEGVVTVVFVVDSAGKVSSPRVEKSTNVAFEKPALDAVKQWKFEPGIKGGQRVACRMRVPIRFQPS